MSVSWFGTQGFGFGVSICISDHYGSFIGTVTSTEGLASYLPSIEARLEHDIISWVKAAIESSIGQLSTVGAMATDEFL